MPEHSPWQVRGYFQTYYSGGVLPDEQVLLRFQLQALSQAQAATDHRLGRALEYGCGASLHRAIATSKYVFRLDLADWLPDNLRRVREWLQADGSNSDWNRFTRYILQCESNAASDPSAATDASAAGGSGSATDGSRIARRESMTRRAVRGMHTSDPRWRHPLGRTREGYYDLIVSAFCLDAVSGSKRVWRSCMRNVLSMLAPGGLLILHALHRCRAYQVGARMFPGSNVSEDDVAGSLAECGFSREQCDITVAPSPDHLVHGYAGILMACARKGA